MKDFPLFTTEFGVASLILKEIPYKQTAYIKLQDTLDPEQLLNECVSFCRICGAEHIYVSGHEYVERFPFHTAVWEMKGKVTADERGQLMLWPVLEENVSEWRELYNRKMRNVPNAGTLEKRDEKKILESCGAYFVHDNGELYGIGWLKDNRIEAIASVKPGAGERICRALQTLNPDGILELEVASENKKAVALYERLGFLRTRELSKWYKVL